MSERYQVHDDQYGLNQTTDMEWEGSPNNGVTHITKEEWGVMVLGRIHDGLGLSTTDFFDHLNSNQLSEHEAVPEILDLLRLRKTAQQDLVEIETQILNART